ncbi:MAG TPA: hypothetical protein VKA53_06570 [Thermoanaerobaculia bacterium]|nr:hypothetical protein [Thermoanaerobaculia bacterium]
MERTFPSHGTKSELHGLTVVVETHAGDLCIGRCYDVVTEGVILLDADTHAAGSEGVSRAVFLDRAARFGVWPKQPRLIIAREDVVSLKLLADF